MCDRRDTSSTPRGVDALRRVMIVEITARLTAERAVTRQAARSDVASRRYTLTPRACDSERYSFRRYWILRGEMPSIRAARLVLPPT